MNKILPFLITVFLLGCQQTEQQNSEPVAPVAETGHHIESLTEVFDAHGGYQLWSSMKSLSYEKGDESTVTNLQNRKIRVESPEQTFGFDGEDVWVLPDSADASRARFYHNLYFYFYAMPFVVGDPGARYEEVEPKELQGKEYNGIKVSYGDGVGDSPEDNYILWYDPETNQMEWLMYTVTYTSGEPSDKYSLIKYEGWESIEGLRLATTLQWYMYDGETVGEKRGEPSVFTNVRLSTDAPSSDLFEMPVGAQVAPR